MKILRPLSYWTALALALASGSVGCDLAQPPAPEQSSDDSRLDQLHARVIALWAELDDSPDPGPDELEAIVAELDQIAEQLEVDLELASSPSGEPHAAFEPTECAVADIQLSLAKLSFAFVVEYSLLNFDANGDWVHYSAYVEGLSAQDSSALAADDFTYSPDFLVMLPQLAPTLALATSTLAHAQDVDDVLGHIRQSWGPYAFEVHDSLENGINATNAAIDAINACAS